MRKPQQAPAQINHVNEHEVTGVSWCPCQPDVLACCSEDSTLTLWNSQPNAKATHAADSWCIYYEVEGALQQGCAATLQHHQTETSLAAQAAHAALQGSEGTSAQQSAQVAPPRLHAGPAGGPAAAQADAAMAQAATPAQPQAQSSAGARHGSGAATGWVMNVSPQRHGRSGLAWHNNDRAPGAMPGLANLAADDASQPTRFAPVHTV